MDFARSGTGQKRDTEQSGARGFGKKKKATEVQQEDERETYMIFRYVSVKLPDGNMAQWDMGKIVELKRDDTLTLEMADPSRPAPKDWLTIDNFLLPEIVEMNSSGETIVEPFVFRCHRRKLPGIMILPNRAGADGRPHLTRKPRRGA